MSGTDAVNDGAIETAEAAPAAQAVATNGPEPTAMPAPTEDAPASTDGSGFARVPYAVSRSPPARPPPAVPDELVEDLFSADLKRRAAAVVALKAIVVRLAAEESFDFIPRNVVAKLVEIMGYGVSRNGEGASATSVASNSGASDAADAKDAKEALLNAAWIVTKMTATSTTLTGVLITEGLVPILVRHLANEANEDMRVQSVWILGNIAGDGPSRRDLVLQNGVLAPLLHLISQETRFKRQENVTHVLNLQAVRLSVWCLSNLCRGRPGPPPNFASLLPSLPVLARMLQAQDKEILRDTCFAFANLSDGTHEKIQSVINSGVVGRLVQLMEHPSKMVVASALRAVGNILLGDDFQTQIVIDNNGLPALLQLLLNDDEHVRKDACRAVSNVTAGSAEQIQAVLSAGIFPVLIALMQTPSTKGVDVEAGWAVLNVAKRGTQDQLEALSEMGCDPRLFQLSSAPGAHSNHSTHASTHPRSSVRFAGVRGAQAASRFTLFRRNNTHRPAPANSPESVASSATTSSHSILNAIVVLGSAAAMAAGGSPPTAVSAAAAAAAAGSAEDDDDEEDDDAPSATVAVDEDIEDSGQTAEEEEEEEEEEEDDDMGIDGLD